MHNYRVMESQAGDSRFSLRCNNGRHHLARALNLPPAQGTVLNGAKPHLGFGVLVCPVSGVVFRVIFETINQPSPAFDTRWVPNDATAAQAALHNAAR